MNRNIRIAKELVRLAKSLVAYLPSLPPGYDAWRTWTPWDDEDDSTPWDDIDTFSLKNELFKKFIDDMKKSGFEYVSHTKNKPEDETNKWTLKTNVQFKRIKNRRKSMSDDEFEAIGYPENQLDQYVDSHYDQQFSFEIIKAYIDEPGKYIVTLCSTYEPDFKEPDTYDPDPDYY